VPATRAPRPRITACEHGSICHLVEREGTVLSLRGFQIPEAILGGFRWKFQQAWTRRLENRGAAPQQILELAIGENRFHDGRFFPVTHSPSAQRIAEPQLVATT